MGWRPERCYRVSWWTKTTWPWTPAGLWSSNPYWVSTHHPPFFRVCGLFCFTGTVALKLFEFLRFLSALNLMLEFFFVINNNNSQPRLFLRVHLRGRRAFGRQPAAVGQRQPEQAAVPREAGEVALFWQPERFLLPEGEARPMEDEARATLVEVSESCGVSVSLWLRLASKSLF